jgi:DNA-binding response OmpR family regulator/ketosteroid isomerase-like protein
MMTPFSFPPRLLVVEHDVGIQDLLHASLTAEGYAVSLAASPAEALPLLAEQPFQLVLTDLFSANCTDRLGAVEPLRASAYPTPVGVITGWNVAEEEVTRRGFAFLAGKPFDLEELFALIAACLNSSLNPGAAAFLPARVLLVDPDEAARASLAGALVQGGYAVARASSLEAALALVDERCFHLILAALPGGGQFGGQAHLVQRLARPTPVGVIIEQHLSPEEAVEPGFAFLAPRSMDQAELLKLVHGTIRQPLSTEQQRQMQIARRFFMAIETEDWETMAALCHKEFVCYPPTNSKITLVREVRGIHAYRVYKAAVMRGYPGYHPEEELLYAYPQGIAARYRYGWTSPGGQPQHVMIGKLVRFKGERISEMRLWVNTRELQPVVRALEKRSSA